MYAVIKANGRQFSVKEGDTIVLNRLNAKEGDKVAFNEVLLVGGSAVSVGAPFVKGASVAATVKSHSLGEKVLVFKYKRRKNYKRTKGHRQALTTLEIGKISL
jgi:large subunit ribosomal protein L21